MSFIVGSFVGRETIASFARERQVVLCWAALMVVAPNDPGGLSVAIAWSAGLAGLLLAFLLLGVSEMLLVLGRIERHLRKDTDEKVRR